MDDKFYQMFYFEDDDIFLLYFSFMLVNYSNFSKFSITWLNTFNHSIWCEKIVFQLCFQQWLGPKQSSVLNGWKLFRFCWWASVDPWRLLSDTCLILRYNLNEWNGRMHFSKWLRWLWKYSRRVTIFQSTIYISVWT